VTSRSHSHWQYWPALLLLAALFAQSALTATRTSLTIDEGLHITSGYSILRTGDFRLIEEQPPLVKLLAALPLLPVRDLPDPRTLSDWETDASVPDTVHLVRVMKQWLLPYRPFDRVIYAARVPIMLLSLLLGTVVFRWASDLGGPWAGLIALGLYAFDPNIVAHSSVAAIDLGAAAFVVFASYTFWRALRRPTRINVALAGVMLGLALAAKVSTLILLPVFFVLTGLRALTMKVPAFLGSLPVRRWAHTAGRIQVLMWLGLLMGVIVVLAGVTLWAVYGFEMRTPLGWRIPIPAASHLIPLERVRYDVTAGRTTFLMGQYSQRGWWYYFPVAFAIKTPLPMLFLLLIAILSFTLRSARTKQWGGWNTLALAIFPWVYFATAIAQPFDIGYRHLLPILPFIAVFIGLQISNFKFQMPNLKSRMYWVFGILGLWYMVGTVRIFPDYLAYFNELVGGPDGGYHYLVDSNLDWGQAWKELKRYMDAHGIARIKFAQFSSNDPATYGIDYEPIAPMADAPPVLPSRFNPAPGVYVLSASSLQGVPMADINTYDYFRHRSPTARIGHALFVYDVRPVEPRPGWVASCAAPTPPLEPSDIAAGFGRDDLRLVYFDCQQTWVLPGNSANGWIMLPYKLARDKNAFAYRGLSSASLVFEQKQSFDLPPHSVFLALVGGAMPSVQSMQSVSATFDRTAELSGYTLDRTTARPGQSVELLTLWRVTGRPLFPLSIMAHLWADDGRAIAVGDGLGFTAEQWQVGDVFVQRSLLRVPSDTPPGTVWVQMGLYTLSDLRRLNVTQSGVVVGDSLRLAPLRVEP
jgi:4-amino-4-deoxy-L-arabinose transferase-like glycosyltransferase